MLRASPGCFCVIRLAVFCASPSWFSCFTILVVARASRGWVSHTHRCSGCYRAGCHARVTRRCYARKSPDWVFRVHCRARCHALVAGLVDVTRVIWLATGLLSACCKTSVITRGSKSELALRCTFLFGAHGPNSILIRVSML